MKKAWTTLFSLVLTWSAHAAPESFAAPPPDPQKFARVIDVVRDFGAKGDGKTDDWQACRAVA